MLVHDQIVYVKIYYKLRSYCKLEQRKLPGVAVVILGVVEAEVQQHLHI